MAYDLFSEFVSLQRLVLDTYCVRKGRPNGGGREVGDKLIMGFVTMGQDFKDANGAQTAALKLQSLLDAQGLPSKLIPEQSRYGEIKPTVTVEFTRNAETWTKVKKAKEEFAVEVVAAQSKDMTDLLTHLYGFSEAEAAVVMRRAEPLRATLR